GEDPVSKADVGDFNTKNMGSKLLRLVEDFLHGAVKRRAGQRRGTRAAGPLPEEDLVGIALHISGLIGMNAKTVTDQLLEHGLVALALRDPPGEKRERARAIEAHFRALEAKRARALDRIRKAEAAQPAPLFRRGAPFGEACNVGAAQPLVEDLFELAAVIG